MNRSIALVIETDHSIDDNLHHRSLRQYRHFFHWHAFLEFRRQLQDDVLQTSRHGLVGDVMACGCLTIKKSEFIYLQNPHSN